MNNLTSNSLSLHVSLLSSLQETTRQRVADAVNQATELFGHLVTIGEVDLSGEYSRWRVPEEPTLAVNHHVTTQCAVREVLRKSISITCWVEECEAFLRAARTWTARARRFILAQVHPRRQVTFANHPAPPFVRER